jgi:hypothetical protein
LSGGWITADCERCGCEYDSRKSTLGIFGGHSPDQCINELKKKLETLQGRFSILTVEKEDYYAKYREWMKKSREKEEELYAEESYSHQLAQALRPYAREAARWDGIKSPPTNRDTTVVMIDCRIGFFVAAREAMERPKKDS